MNNEITKQKILEFLHQNDLGVISTIHVGKSAPESALVGFGATENLELVFGTYASTRKYKNLQSNPVVAFVTGFSGATGTLQYEGVAHELSREEQDPYIALLVKKNVDHQRFANNPEQRYFLVKPTWIRLYISPSESQQVWELEF